MVPAVTGRPVATTSERRASSPLVFVGSLVRLAAAVAETLARSGFRRSRRRRTRRRGRPLPRRVQPATRRECHAAVHISSTVDSVFRESAAQRRGGGSGIRTRDGRLTQTALAVPGTCVRRRTPASSSWPSVRRCTPANIPELQPQLQPVCTRAGACRHLRALRAGPEVRRRGQ